MEVGGNHGGAGRPTVYCIVPRELARLHEPLRRHFRDDPLVEVVVERRVRERRRQGDRRDRTNRSAEAPPPGAPQRRRIHNAAGRRIGGRRAAPVPVEPPPLPRRAQRYAEQIVFVERLEPSGECAEDVDSARLVVAFQAGDREAFGVLYMRYFDRAYGYLRMALKDPHEAEDATQQVFLQALVALPRYELRRQPFRAWLFSIARNRALDQLRKHGRLQPVDPASLLVSREQAGAAEPEPPALDWLSDRDLVMFVERLPLAQRQVLVLRYMLGLDAAAIAEVLGRTPADVRSLHHRAVTVLRQRLAAVGRSTGRDRPIRMRRWPKPATVLRRRRYALRP